MTITNNVSVERPSAQRHSAFYWALADAFVVAKRQIKQIPRIPDELVTAILQPAIVVLLFGYVIGGAVGTATGTIAGTANMLMGR